MLQVIVLFKRVLNWLVQIIPLKFQLALVAALVILQILLQFTDYLRLRLVILLIFWLVLQIWEFQVFAFPCLQVKIALLVNLLILIPLVILLLLILKLALNQSKHLIPITLHFIRSIFLAHVFIPLFVHKVSRYLSIRLYQEPNYKDHLQLRNFFEQQVH